MTDRDERPVASGSVLELRDLSVTYRTDGGPVPAVRGVNLSIETGDTVGLAGESGCGKSTIASAVLRLLPKGTRVDGEVLLDGEDVYKMTPGRLRAVRWTSAAIVFQGALHSLNPVQRVGSQIEEAILVHSASGVARARSARVGDLLERVGIRAGRPASIRTSCRGAAPTRADRARAGLRAQAPHRRRADDCARRDGAGAGIGPARRAAARPGPGDAVHHPRPVGADERVGGWR